MLSYNQEKGALNIILYVKICATSNINRKKKSTGKRLRLKIHKRLNLIRNRIQVYFQIKLQENKKKAGYGMRRKKKIRYLLGKSNIRK